MIGGGPDSPLPRIGLGLVSMNMMPSFLVAARPAPASEDGVQRGGVKRPCVLTVREPAKTFGAVEEPGRRQTATRLADGERGDERAVRRRILLIRRSRASVTRWMEWGGKISRAFATSW